MDHGLNFTSDQQARGKEFFEDLTNSRFLIPQYRISFFEKLAEQYKPIVYSNECLSGPPEGLYYRIVVNPGSKSLCLLYFFYWTYQTCTPSHVYDYEPIFIYLKQDDYNPYLIVNGGFAGMDCGFHKNEIRPSEGERIGSIVRFSEKMSPAPYYPFGREGNVEYEGCYEQYPLNGDDLQFEGMHPLFGIRACSNVFSGAPNHLRGERFDPSLKKLSDDVLLEWYYNHHNNKNDMPFGHDIADPFSFPHIKFHRPTGEELKKME